MFAIIDGGSTKCDWVILDQNHKVYLKTETIGFNPNIIQPELISTELKKNKE